MKKCWGIVAVAVALVVAAPGRAQEVRYSAVLDGLSESPPNASPGTGTASLVINLDLATMHLEAEFSDLIGTTTAAHIHCCTVDPGELTAGVATQVPTFMDFPLGVTSGTYDKTFDMTEASSYNPSFVTANGPLLDDVFSVLVNGIADGKAYLNIHTSVEGGGEIRGFWQLVPEPTSLLLLGCGLGSVLLKRRR